VRVGDEHAADRLMIAISGCMIGAPASTLAHGRSVTYAMLAPSGDQDEKPFQVSVAPMRVCPGMRLQPWLWSV
jgi:hypothetical protein